MYGASVDLQSISITYANRVQIDLELIPCSDQRDELIPVELQWLEHLWIRENMFETGVVRANEC